MQILQASVAVPDQSTQDLLVSLPVSDASRVPRESVNSGPFHLRVSTRHLQDRSTGDDLVGFASATDAQNQTLVDGGQASGTFQANAGDAGISATVEVTLSGRQIDMIARATNSSRDSRFVAFEWCPRFAAPQGDLNHLVLFVPSRVTPGANGETASTGVLAERFTADAGHPVGTQPFDLGFTRMGREFLSDGTYLRLQNGDRFYLRLIGLGDTLRSVRVQNDPATHSLLLSLSSLDPAAETEQRDQVLRPGQTMQWHLRMEVLPVKVPLAFENSH